MTSETSPKPGSTETSADLADDAVRAERIAAAGRRALAEAAARQAHAAEASEDTDAPRELGGRDGPDPVRYGDWEKKGIAIDF